MSHLTETEVKNKVFVSIFDGQYHITSLITRTLTEIQELLVNFDVGIHSASHHLNLEVLMLDAVTVLSKTHNR
jgi:hypothetical protein